MSRHVKIILFCIAVLVVLFLWLWQGRKDGGESPAPAPAPTARESAPPPAPAGGSEPAPTAPAEPSVVAPAEVPVGEPPVGEPTAAPAMLQHTLTYAAGANGSVEGVLSQLVPRGGAGSAVMAAPAASHHFVKWSDGSTANPRTDVNVTADLSVTAIFAVDQYTLTYRAADNGAIAGVSPQKVIHGGAGSAVTAVPVTGYHFVTWSDGSKANPRSDAGVMSDLTVTANFAANRYNLTYNAGDNGSIEGARSQTVDHGGAGSAVTAVPAKGHHFVGWSDGVSTARRVDTGMTRDLTVSAVFAVNTYKLGGKVSGLAAGNDVVLQNNGGDDLSVAANGSFTFATALPAGRPYAVTVKTQPTTPNQTCTVTKGAGTVDDADVADINIECRLNTYKVGGTVFGLPDGDQLVLRNNKGDDLAVSANGPFVFARALEDGSPYEVTVHSQKLTSKWFCQVEKATGKLAGSDVSDVDVACFREAELLATPALARVDLSWNQQDFPGATFNLCQAQEDIAPVGFGRCAELKGGTPRAKTRSPLTIAKLINDTTYWFQLEVMHASGRRTVSPVVTAVPFGGINDTGIDWCADNDSNRFMDGSRADKETFCKAVAATHPGQDANRGRDAAARNRKLTKTGGGAAGFDFTRVCTSGEAAGEGKCPPNPTFGDGLNNWACTRDNVTGLMWELKTTNGLRNQDNTYTWYNPDADVNGGDPGVQKGGRCSGSGCDTHAYVQAVNVTRLCGGSDWRLPTRQELLSIVDNGRFKPAVDTGYFPNTPVAHYWTSSSYADQTASAWRVYFLYGESYAEKKSQASQVRLVRPAQ